MRAGLGGQGAVPVVLVDPMSASTIGPALVAVVGTLGGVGLSARVALVHHRESRADARRGAALTAVADLATALADHRRAMWVHRRGQLSAADEAVLADSLAASHTTRSALTGPVVAVRVLLPELRGVVDQAVSAVFVLHDSPGLVELERDRQAAKVAELAVVDAAAEVLVVARVRRRRARWWASIRASMRRVAGT